MKQALGDIAVFGAGTMGAGIAFVAARNGHQVTLVDLDSAGLERGHQLIADMSRIALSRGVLDQSGVMELESRMSFSTDPAAAGGVSIVIEAILEDLEAKSSLFGALSACVRSDAIIASNTSSLSVNALAALCSDPSRFAGLHFFNPVPAMKLVEVVPADSTAPMVIQTLAELVRDWGKTPVVTRDVPGFIVNNVARPYYAEAFMALDDGLDPCIVDCLLVDAGGFRMGPLSLADMIGHDINYKVAKTVFDGRGGVTRFRPQPRQAALVAAGMLGRKSGGGVYDYALPSPRPALVPGDRLPGLIRSALDSGAMEGVVTKLEANGCVVERTAALLPGILDVDGTCIAFGDGRRLADRVDADVLLDAVRDWEGFAAIGITARSAAALSAAGSLASALGVKALELPDRPGQIVLRTLAQLANAAADALSENVAHAEGIDIAMSLGANHPEGPVAWSSRFGIARLHAVLTNLAAASGDPIYRPSAGLPLLQVSR